MLLLLTACGAADGDQRPTAADLRASGIGDAILLDVRSEAEWRAGHLREARHLPVDQVAAQATQLLPDRDRLIVTYCRSGGRAQRAAETLRQLGYTQVRALQGGYADLKAAGFTVAE